MHDVVYPLASNSDRFVDFKFVSMTGWRDGTKD